MKEEIPRSEIWPLLIITVGLIMFWIGFALGWIYHNVKDPIIFSIG